VQQTEYISHSEVDENGKKLYALWDEKMYGTRSEAYSVGYLRFQ
jgi:hypothetical protein